MDKPISKSEQVRQYLKKCPYADNNAVIAGLKSEGIEVTANLVNQVRHDYKHKKVQEVKAVVGDEPILKVKKLADEVGGIDNLIRLAFTIKQLFGGEVENGDKEESDSGTDF